MKINCLLPVLGCALLLSGCSSAASPHPDAAPSAQARFRAARSYALCDGKADEASLRNLATYDVAVIDPQSIGGDAEARIAQLKAAGTVVIGYLSCMEVATWHRYRDRVDPAWTIYAEGKPWIPWGENHAMTLSEPRWRALVADLVQSEVLDYGCDGVFMDTLADIDNPTLPKEFLERELDGLEALMRELRTRYPSVIFIGNWTIQRTLPAVARYADGICWEDFSPAHFEDAQTAGWMRDIARNIAAESAKKPHPLVILALWDAPASLSAEERAARLNRMRETACAFGYLPYANTGGYYTPPPPASEQTPQ